MMSSIRLKKRSKPAFTKQYNPATGDTLYFCCVCRRYGTTGRTGKRYRDGGDWAENGVSFKNSKDRRMHYMRRHLSTTQHSKALKRKEEDIPYKVSLGEPKEEDEKVIRENRCRSEQQVVDSKHDKAMKRKKDIPYKISLGEPAEEDEKVIGENRCQSEQHVVDSELVDMQQRKLTPSPESIMPTGTVNPLGNRHHPTTNFKDMLSVFEAGRKHIKDKINSVNTLTKQRRKCSIALDKSTAPFDASREVIVASYMEDNGSIREVLLSAGKISDDPFDHVTRHCEAFMETANVVAVSTDGATNFTGRHTDVFTRMKADSSYSDKMIHLPDFSHQMELLLKNTSPPWLQKTLSEANTISQILTFRSPLSQKLAEMSNSSWRGKFFPMTSVSETRYFESMHQHITSILKNLELLHHFLPVILGAPNPHLQILRDSASVVYNIVRNPVFVSNLLYSDVVFAEVAKVEKMAQSPTFNPSGFIQIIDDFKTFLGLFRTRLPIAVAKLLQTRKVDYSYSYYNQVYTVEVDFHGSSLDFMEEGEYFQWIHRLLLNLKDYVEIPEALRKTCEFFDVKNTEGDRKVDLLRLIYEAFPVDFYCCGVGCEGVESCSCVAKECQTFFRFGKENPRYFLERGKFCHTKFMRKMLAFKTRVLNLPNIYRLIEVFALLKSNRSLTEKVRSVISSTVEERVGTYCLSPKATHDMIEVMVFLQTIDYEEARRIYFENKRSEALVSTESEFQQSKTVQCLEGREETEMKPPRKRKRLKLHDSDEERKISVNSGQPYHQSDMNHHSPPAATSVLSSSSSVPSPQVSQPQQQQTDPCTSLSSHQSSTIAYLPPSVASSPYCQERGPSDHPVEAAHTSPSATPHHLSESVPLSLPPSPSSPHLPDIVSSSHPLLASVDHLLSTSSRPNLSESTPCSPASSEASCHLPAEVLPPHAESTAPDAAASPSLPPFSKIHLPHPAASPVHEEEQPSDILCVCLEEAGKSPEWAFIGCSRSDTCHSRRDRLELLNVPGGDWFHLECMGLKRAPKGRWFCPKCKPKR